METFYMTDVFSLLGLPKPPYGQTSYYVQCPCCDEIPCKRHLNINLTKDVFRCPRCGVSGGIFDLYSLYTGVPREKVYTELAQRLKPSICENRQKIKILSQNVIKEYPIKVGATEVDFVAQKASGTEYYQVTVSMLEESTFNREITPLKNIKDFYPKKVLTLDKYSVGNYDGIIVENIIDWLLT